MNPRHVEALINAGAHPDIAEALACDHAAALDGVGALGGPRLLAFEAARVVREYADGACYRRALASDTAEVDAPELLQAGGGEQ